MRLLTYLLSVLAIAIIVFNLSKINTSAPFENESYTAIITALAGGCAILYLRYLESLKK